MTTDSYRSQICARIRVWRPQIPDIDTVAGWALVSLLWGLVIFGALCAYAG